MTVLTYTVTLLINSNRLEINCLSSSIKETQMMKYAFKYLRISYHEVRVVVMGPV